MIRVNLLPQKRVAARAEQSQTWLIVLAVAAAVEIVVCLYLWQSKDAALTQQKVVNTGLTESIRKITDTTKNHEEVKKKLAVFRQREEAIAKLQSGRTGPTSVLLEVAHVLTRGRGPTVDPDQIRVINEKNPIALPNPSWDSRRLWLTTFKEGDRTVMIDGLAKDGEDVSELARRLTLSKFFGDIKLLPASKSIDSASKAEMVKFQLQAKARY